MGAHTQAIVLASGLICAAVAGTGTAFASATAAERGMTLEQLEQTVSDRFQLVPEGDGYLRLDKLEGTFSYCKEFDSGWRCFPAPLAEEAYEAEIAALSGEIDVLTRKLETAHKARAKTVDALNSAERTIAALQEELAAAERALGEQALPRRPGSAVDLPNGQAGTDDTPHGEGSGSQTLPADEQDELDRVLDFTEDAMRRFFGLVKELQEEFAGQNGSAQ
ncbi:hypothetical protein [Roseibium sp. RKSG952]|uniref:hypothetical protein n=1 Tax=Roseibium sp. RKSG952 TaxID=2529384 RepID=UPI0012BC4FAB|nr:hypothetical protein [Roseibium sp. RKSG952]MTI00219.1 hypothetical protein [Roseibium sp. RKSG952]